MVNTKYQHIAHKIDSFLENTITLSIVTLFTLYALFADDIRLFVTDKNGDHYIWEIYIVSMIIFFFEIALACICKPGYFGSFFFYLDTIATVSLLLDIGWVTEYFFGGDQANQTSSSVQLSKAGKASRVGTKAGRIVRVVRLVRLVKLYKHAYKALQQQKENIKKLEKQIEYNSQMETNLVKPTINHFQKGTQKIVQCNRIFTIAKQSTQLNSIKQQIQQKQTPQIEQNANNDKFKAENNKQSKFIQNRLNPLVRVPSIFVGEANREIIQSNSQVNIHQQQYSSVLKAENHERAENEMSVKEYTVKNSLEEEDQIIQPETKVGQKLSELTTKRVIILVLSIMFSIPIFQIDTYKEIETSFDNGLISIYEFSKKSQNNLMILNLEEYINFHNILRTPVILLDFKKIKDACCQKYPIEDNQSVLDFLRHDDKFYYSYILDGEMIGFAVVDKREDNDLNAILSIARTVFVSIVLSSAAILFSSDVETLVLRPVESMMKKVRRIAKNPLQAAQIEEKETILIQQLIKNKNQKELNKRKEMDLYETVILEKLIIKIGALLVIGFGESGSQIIAANMSQSGQVKPLILGKKIIAIFGFCCIQNQANITEILQTEIMVFVNEIAEIVHSIVDIYIGSPNKNTGDGFLLVWKFEESDCIRADKQIALKDNYKTKNFADLSIISYLKIMYALYSSTKFQKYSKNIKLTQLNFKLQVTFGLHVGWAIEGALGSTYKIDASYLSPNVNMATRLESANKQFGTNILISSDLYNILSIKCQIQLRNIDRIMLKGQENPMDLYTIDFCLNRINNLDLTSNSENQDSSQMVKKKLKILQRIKRNKLREDICKKKMEIARYFQSDKEIFRMRFPFNQGFYKEWEKGYLEYIKGNWKESVVIFQKTLNMLEEVGYIDGPSYNLIKFIEQMDGVVPQNWKGFRNLLEK